MLEAAQQRSSSAHLPFCLSHALRICRERQAHEVAIEVVLLESW